MNAALTRKLAVVQAQFNLIDELSESFVELGDMQTHRLLRDDMSEFIASRAQRGDVPPNPLKYVLNQMTDLDAVLNRTSEEVARLSQIGKEVLEPQERSLTRSKLELLTQEATRCIENLPSTQQRLAETMTEDFWVRSKAGFDLHPELIHIANLRMSDSLLVQSEFTERNQLYQFTRGQGPLHDQVSQHLIATHGACLMRVSEYERQTSVLAQAKALSSQKNHRQAHALLKGLRRHYQDIRYEEVEANISTSFDELRELESASKDALTFVSAKLKEAEKKRWLWLELPFVARTRAIRREVTAIFDALGKKRQSFLGKLRDLPPSEFVTDGTVLLEQVTQQSESSKNFTLKRLSSLIHRRALVLGFIHAASIVLIGLVVIDQKRISFEAKLAAEAKVVAAAAEANAATERRLLWTGSGMRGAGFNEEKIVRTLTFGGNVFAWGDNSSYQCNVPAGLSGVVAIAAGGIHTVALKQDGNVVAWGYNSYDQSNVPAGLSNVVAIAAGKFHTVALRLSDK